MSRNPFGIVPQEIFKMGLSTGAIAAFAALSTFADANRCANPSVETLARMIGMKKGSAKRLLAELRDSGAVSIRPRYDTDGGQLTNDYAILLPRRRLHSVA